MHRQERASCDTRAPAGKFKEYDTLLLLLRFIAVPNIIVITGGVIAALWADTSAIAHARTAQTFRFVEYRARIVHGTAIAGTRGAANTS